MSPGHPVRPISKRDAALVARLRSVGVVLDRKPVAKLLRESFVHVAGVRLRARLGPAPPRQVVVPSPGSLPEPIPGTLGPEWTTSSI